MMPPTLNLPLLPSEFSLRLILIRHGEPVREAQGKCYGSLDVSLSESGRMQIQEKLPSVCRLGGDALYSSPLKRAMESAAIVGSCLCLEPTPADELREVDFGSFEGLTYEAIERLYPQEYKVWMERPTEIQFPHGGSFVQVKRRVLSFKAFLLENHPGKTVHVVSHGSINRILVAEALAIPDSMVFRVDQSYAALNIIDYLQGSPLVRLMNG
jgi:alpha-ribazole phosphatase/probable phosphoglycerate mutase